MPGLDNRFSSGESLTGEFILGVAVLFSKIAGGHFSDKDRHAAIVRGSSG
jgi:hypothetical protein